MAVWICLNYTKPRAPTKRSVRVSITNIRLAMNFSSSTFTVEWGAPRSTLPSNVQQHPAVNSMAVPGLLPEERRCVLFRSQRDKSVITPQSPPSGVPAHAATDVAREERLCAVDAERLLLEQTQSANATSDVRNDGRLVWCGDN